jgi:hypothetical protein
MLKKDKDLYISFLLDYDKIKKNKNEINALKMYKWDSLMYSIWFYKETVDLSINDIIYYLVNNYSSIKINKKQYTILELLKLYYNFILLQYKYLKNLMNKSNNLPLNITLFRGFNLKKYGLTNDYIFNIIKNKSFNLKTETSWTLDKKIALSFAGIYDKKHKETIIIFELTINKDNIKFIPIPSNLIPLNPNDNSHYNILDEFDKKQGTEVEILLQRNLQLNLINIENIKINKKNIQIFKFNISKKINNNKLFSFIKFIDRLHIDITSINKEFYNNIIYIKK